MPVSDIHSANVLLAEGRFDPTASITEIHLADGRTFHIPTALLREDEISTVLSNETPVTNESPTVVPLIEEQLDVSKRTVATGTVRLEKTVETYDVAVDEPLAVSTWSVERLPMHVQVDAPPAVRQEGNTTIYPLLEEQLLLTKQLILIEEIHVKRNDFERKDTQTVTLRREQVTVDREPLS